MNYQTVNLESHYQSKIHSPTLLTSKYRSTGIKFVNEGYVVPTAGLRTVKLRNCAEMYIISFLTNHFAHRIRISFIYNSITYFFKHNYYLYIVGVLFLLLFLLVILLLL